MVAVLSQDCCHLLKAQQLGIWYDSELQFDLEGRTRHLNLLYLSTCYQPTEHVKFSAATISIARTSDEPLIDDLQVFSNIDADQVPLTLAIAGIGWEPDERHSLFVGIRNVNEDYFTSPVTSLFTNSSWGIYPTLSCIQDIANYPLAAVGVHYAYTGDALGFQASMYNGLGHQDFTGRQNVWRFVPSSDGLFLITQASYSHNDNSYYAGACYHSGTNDDHFTGRSALWGYTEQQLTPNLAMIASLSHAFGSDTACTDFAGLGVQYNKGKATWGMFTDYARFSTTNEYANELTLRYDFSPTIFMQASYHLIHNSSWMQAGLIRLGIRIGDL